MSENIQTLVANDSSKSEETVLTTTENISFLHKASLATDEPNPQQKHKWRKKPEPAIDTKFQAYSFNISAEHIITSCSIYHHSNEAHALSNVNKN